MTTANELREKISDWLNDRNNNEYDLVYFLIDECGVVLKPEEEEEEVECVECSTIVPSSEAELTGTEGWGICDNCIDHDEEDDDFYKEDDCCKTCEQTDIEICYDCGECADPSRTNRCCECEEEEEEIEGEIILLRV